MKKFKFSIFFLVTLLTSFTIPHYAWAEPSEQYSTISEVVKKWGGIMQKKTTLSKFKQKAL